MTREEAIKEIEERVQVTEYIGSSYVDCVDIEALRMAVSALEQPEIVRCKDCEFTDGEIPLADGRYWCILHSSIMYFCSDAERRER